MRGCRASVGLPVVVDGEVDGVLAVYAAGLAGGATDPAKAADDGLKFFAELNRNGNFVPAIGKAASIAQGETPVLVFQSFGRVVFDPVGPISQTRNQHGTKQINRLSLSRLSSRSVFNHAHVIRMQS